MSFVERAHGGNKANLLAGVAPLANLFSYLANRTDGLDAFHGFALLRVCEDGSEVCFLAQETISSMALEQRSESL